LPQQDTRASAFSSHFSSSSSSSSPSPSSSSSSFLQAIVFSWRNFVHSTKYLRFKHTILRSITNKQQIRHSLSRLFYNSITNQSNIAQHRAATAAAAVKEHAAQTVKALMQQLETAQLEIDCYRKEAMLSMVSQAEESQFNHQQQRGHQHQHQHQHHHHHHAISSSLSSTDSWNSTADFVKAKLSSLNVREL
jgi:multidrug efflux pump subunit AcrA (membrane-fusion protein)